MLKLEPKQEAFCREYVLDQNATDAAIRAGYSKKSAKSQASRMLTKANIQAFIKELQQETMKRHNLTEDIIIEELMALGLYNVQDLVSNTNSVLNLKKTKRALLKPVVGIKVTERIIGEGKGAIRIVTTDLKLANKADALGQLGKHLGIFEKDNNQKSLKIKVTRK